MKNNTTQGLGNENLLSFPWLTEILETEKQCQQSYVNTICESIRVTLLIIFRFVGRQIVSPKKLLVQTTWIFRLQKIWQAVNYQARVTEVVKDMCDKLNGYLFFNWYLRLGNQILDFLMVGSARLLPRKTFLFSATPVINNNRSLTLITYYDYEIIKLK
jgi:hypothetical protein